MASPRKEPIEVNRKLAILGFREVGKTTLATQFAEGSSTNGAGVLGEYEPTIENTFRKTITIGRARFNTEIVDTAGMDEYSRLSRNASVGVHGYLLVFSTTSRSSFDKVRLINEVLLNMLGDALDVPRVLVGSKLDLQEQRQVNSEEGASLADEWGVPYWECSARANINVDKVFTAVVQEIEKDSGLLIEEKEEPCIII
uniref:Uncharacterized protein n=1 Tax=Fibrocapsa japonica TaxID=94617 RepID=A0A7S2XWX8_9STRA|mmetsp:Transcript_20627/g.29846  ORF Transcript_20627/g.29846 Transcript_20627/m.29846 type:complete len:199 (+) Transcript_20627:162-758(+)|eukprot:CAMPEP_0113943284 /NCGR_PEP_ID=MMETSP1339-20121228/23163_1 /TAXON_ID=94617 /ORGANISM="Fibrocapsa japonica" /LENGTH=198 /DNA_ID=CAMNT_0000948121 /DNA_START=153 /DNA_END=749 /DNA_ORIENTATION=- /assembly_acc=CAM_ASM_000762